MARDRMIFRQRDVTAAIKAVERAGHKVARVEIGRDGKITIVPAGSNEAIPENALDKWLKEHAR